MTKRCTDCGLSLTYWVVEVDGNDVRLEADAAGAEGPYESHQDEHEGLCCDCFDESLGMEPECRSWPRPDA